MAGAVNDVVELDSLRDLVPREVPDGHCELGSGGVEPHRADDVLEADVLLKVELGEPA